MNYNERVKKMHYKYEPGTGIYSMEYENKIEKIERLREHLSIDTNALSIILNNDIYNSTKLEGNTLNKREVTYYLETGATIRGKSFKDFVQIHNQKNALDILKSLIKEKNIELTEELITQIHKIITSNELDYKESGFYRTFYTKSSRRPRRT